MQTIRFYGSNLALDFLEQLGGRIKLEIEYPSGFTPDPAFRPSVKLVRPRFYQQSYSTNWPVPQALIVSGRALGQVNPCGIAQQGGKAVAWCNVWGGMQNALKPSTQSSLYETTTRDQWGDTSQTNGPGPQMVSAARRIVIFGETAGNFPTGTKITVSVIPKIPRTQQALNAFFNPWANTLDASQQQEAQPLAFVSAGDDGVEVVRIRNSGSVITDDKKYLSFGEQPVSPPGMGQQYTGPYPTDQFVYTLVVDWGSGWGSAVFPTGKAQLFPVLAACLVPIRMRLSGLADASITTLTVVGENQGRLKLAEFVQVESPPTSSYIWYTKPERHIIQGGAWSMAAQIKLLKPEGV